MRRSLVHDYLRKFLPDLLDDDVWLSLFDEDGNQYRSTDEIYQKIESKFDSVIPKIESALEHINSPMQRLGKVGLNKFVMEAAEQFDNLSPPSVALSIGDATPDQEKFWLLMYAAWHYRLSERFHKIVKMHQPDGTRKFHLRPI